jgi:hypothetical protein
MKTTKHTPGPWRIGALESGQAAVDSASGAEVTGWVSIPDARLIAAAPDMLEALEELCLTFEAIVGGELITAKARAAIKKARGEQS